MKNGSTFFGSNFFSSIEISAKSLIWCSIRAQELIRFKQNKSYCLVNQTFRLCTQRVINPFLDNPNYFIKLFASNFDQNHFKMDIKFLRMFHNFEWILSSTKTLCILYTFCHSIHWPFFLLNVWLQSRAIWYQETDKHTTECEILFRP